MSSDCQVSTPSAATTQCEPADKIATLETEAAIALVTVTLQVQEAQTDSSLGIAFQPIQLHAVDQDEGAAAYPYSIRGSLICEEVTPYAGVTLVFQVRFPCDFPRHPPRLFCETPILHDAINRQSREWEGLVLPPEHQFTQCPAHRTAEKWLEGVRSLAQYLHEFKKRLHHASKDWKQQQAQLEERRRQLELVYSRPGAMSPFSLDDDAVEEPPEAVAPPSGKRKRTAMQQEDALLNARRRKHSAAERLRAAREQEARADLEISELELELCDSRAREHAASLVGK